MDHRESKRIPEKNTCFISYAKAFDWITTNCGKFLEIGIPDNLTCLLKNLYAGQKATVRTGYGPMDRLKTGEEVCQRCILSPAYLTSLQSTSCKMLGWMKQAGIEISRRNINNLRYTDNTTLMAESKEELKSLLMKVNKENKKTGLKHTIQKMKIIPSLVGN